MEIEIRSKVDSLIDLIKSKFTNNIKITLDNLELVDEKTVNITVSVNNDITESFSIEV